MSHENIHYMLVNDGEAADGTVVSTKTGWKHSQFSRSTAFACLLCVACTVLNLGLLGLPFHAVSQPKPPSLRRPSSYIGLDCIKSFPHVTEQLTNFPMLLTQVSSEASSKVYPDDPHEYTSFRETISPEERPFYLTSAVSTIAQWRIRDYGMERCVLAVSIPFNSTGQPGQTDATGKFVPGGYELQGDTGSIELWKLTYTSPEPLDVRSLSWRTKPTREYLLATLNIQAGQTTRTREFPCAADSLQTFEFACPWEDCTVDFWQDKTDDTLAATIVQFPSVAS